MKQKKRRYMYEKHHSFIPTARWLWPDAGNPQLPPWVDVLVDGCFGSYLCHIFIQENQVRSDGQNRLYWKLLRRMAEHGISNGSGETVKHLMEAAHEFFKVFYGAGKSTKEMSKEEMHLYYSTCQRHSILMLGVSGMDEDSKPFDHGFVDTQ